MPWVRTLLPPSPGAVRAVDPVSLVVWTEHGLFRYEPGPNPCVRMLHDAAGAAGKFDPATGVMRWGRERYRLVGDPAVVPHPGVEPRAWRTLWDDNTIRVDARRGQTEVVDPAGTVTLVVDDFPAAGAAWHFAGFERGLVLADPGGLRRYDWVDPPPTPAGKWAAVGGGYAGLLAGAIASPDDDLPRLVLADWLEEHGDAARAEFMRLQCRIADRERTAPVPDNDPDRVRANELAKAHSGGWRAELPRVAGVRMMYSDAREWWRGFPTVSVNSAVTLGGKLAPLLAAAPVEWAEVRSLDPRGAAALLKSPVAARLRVLELAVDSDDAEVAARTLLASPQLAGLRGLVLRGAVTHNDTLVTAAAHLTALEWLSVTWADDPALEALADSPHPPNVRWVRVGGKRSVARATRRALEKRFAHVAYSD